MKNTFLTGIGIVGSLFVSLFGGWTAALTTLFIFMLIDYFTGFLVAAVFHNSPKTASGAYESNAGLKGLVRKFMILLFVGIGYRLDLLMGATYIKDGICIAFIANELMSIIENAGLMGLYVPPVLQKALDVLNDKNSDKESEE